MDKYTLFYKRSQSLGQSGLGTDATDAKMGVLTSGLSSDFGVQIQIGSNIYDVVLIDKKDSEEESIKSILSSYENNIEVGDIFSYGGDDWLIFSQEYDVVDAFFEGEAIRCNQEISFLNDYGDLVIAPVFLVGSMKTFESESFQGTPLTEKENNRLKVICSEKSGIKENTRFNTKNKTWKVVNIDNDSIEGISYLSCLEDESYADDSIVAQSDYSEWSIIQSDIKLMSNEWYEINPTFLKNDIEKEHDFYIDTDSENIEIDENFIKILIEGTENAKVVLTGTEIEKHFQIEGYSEEEEYVEYEILPKQKTILSGMNYTFYAEKRTNGSISETSGDISITSGEELLNSYDINNNTISFVVSKDAPLDSLIILNYSENGNTITKELRVKRLL